MFPVYLTVLPKESVPLYVPVPVRVCPWMPVTVPLMVPVLLPETLLVKLVPCVVVRSPVELLV